MQVFIQYALEVNTRAGNVKIKSPNDGRRTGRPSQQDPLALIPVSGITVSVQPLAEFGEYVL